jgi:hypothetical protein
MALMVVALTAVASAQSGQAVPGGGHPTEEPDAFDVVSIKLSPVVHGRPEAPKIRMNPTSFYGTDAPVTRLVMEAYGVKPYQIIGQPEWALEENYDVQAKTAEPVSPEKMRSLLGALLAGRFKLRFHTETREMAGYNLVVGKGGPKMNSGGTGMDLVASVVSNILRTKVVDQTGLEGKYSFSLLPTGALGDAPSDMSLLEKIAASLHAMGLRLVAAKVSVGFIVVEHVERPELP